MFYQGPSKLDMLLQLLWRKATKAEWSLTLTTADSDLVVTLVRIAQFTFGIQATLLVISKGGTLWKAVFPRDTLRTLH